MSLTNNSLISKSLSFVPLILRKAKLKVGPGSFWIRVQSAFDHWAIQTIGNMSFATVGTFRSF